MGKVARRKFLELIIDFFEAPKLVASLFDKQAPYKKTLLSWDTLRTPREE